MSLTKILTRIVGWRLSSGSGLKSIASKLGLDSIGVEENELKLKVLTCLCQIGFESSHDKKIDLLGNSGPFGPHLLRSLSETNFLPSLTSLGCFDTGESEKTERTKMDDEKDSRTIKTIERGLSRLELKVSSYLEKHNIKYITEHEPKDCKHHQQLRFDFYLPDFNAHIEVDGYHHFEEGVNYGSGPSNSWSVLYHDQIKNSYDRKCKIHLLRLAYSEVYYFKQHIAKFLFAISYISSCDSSNNSQGNSQGNFESNSLIWFCGKEYIRESTIFVEDISKTKNVIRLSSASSSQEILEKSRLFSNLQGVVIVLVPPKELCRGIHEKSSSLDSKSKFCSWRSKSSTLDSKSEFRPWRSKTSSLDSKSHSLESKSEFRPWRSNKTSPELSSSLNRDLNFKKDIEEYKKFQEGNTEKESALEKSPLCSSSPTLTPSLLNINAKPFFLQNTKNTTIPSKLIGGNVDLVKKHHNCFKLN